MSILLTTARASVQQKPIRTTSCVSRNSASAIVPPPKLPLTAGAENKTVPVGRDEGDGGP